MNTIPYFRIRGDRTAEAGLSAEQLADHPLVSMAEGVFIYDESESFEDAEKAVSFLRVLCSRCRGRVLAKVRAHKQEDVKKILYAGCAMAVVELGPETKEEYLKDVSNRFGKEKIAAMLPAAAAARTAADTGKDGMRDPEEDAAAGEIRAISEYVRALIVPVGIAGESVSEIKEKNAPLPILLLDEKDGVLDLGDAEDFLRKNPLQKYIPWDALKKGPDGLVPCIVQDVKNDEVLMMAWMNEEAYEATLRTGRMTYYSRSRGELWIKGETSGHYQYLKSLSIDCDSDTLLAKVEQIGAACHTGSRSCFYTELWKDESYNHSPNRVFRDVYEIIADRKEHPKEGSYTTYLFEKGIDKILKKLGEEATEIVIAAKNPDPEEVKYEIADFLYHAMVLMVERGLTWEEITTELARR